MELRVAVMCMRPFILFQIRPRRGVLDARQDRDVAAAETLTEMYGI